MKVSDVMQRNVARVDTQTSVEDVVRLIFGMGINGVPVCRKGSVVGFISERDVLAKFYPDDTEEYIKKTLLSQDFGRMEEKASQIFKLTAEDIMSKQPVTVKADAPLLRAQSLMFIHKVGRLPVVNERGALLGILSRGDIFKALIGERLALEEIEEYNDWLSNHQLVNVDWKKRKEYEIPDLTQLFKESRCRTILDNGCGTGEHSIALCENEFSVCGIERSKFMFEDAERKRSKLPNEIKGRLTFLFGESEEVVGGLKNKFDAAIFMGNALAFNPHNWQGVLKKTTEKLVKTGFVVLQMRNIDKVLTSQKRTTGMTFDKGQPTYDKRMLFEFYNPPKKEKEATLKTSVLFDFDGKKWIFHGLKSIPLAYITKQKLETALKKLDFNDIRAYGSTQQWDYLFRSTFDPVKSDWLNIVAKR